jgi:hypothetical protein
VRILGVLDRHGDEVVLLQDLDGALGAAGAVGDEEHRVAALARLPHVRHPIVHPSVELDRRLAAHVTDRSRPVVLQRQFLEASRRRRTRRQVVPGDEGLFGRDGGDVPARRCVGIAALELLAGLPCLLLDLLVLGDQDLHAVGGGEELQHRDWRLRLLEAFADGYDDDLIGGAG